MTPTDFEAMLNDTTKRIEGDIVWPEDEDHSPWLEFRAEIEQGMSSLFAADGAYQNARKNSDKQNARIEHDKALARVMTAVLKDDTELFKQFSDNEDFKKWLTDTVFTLTYSQPTADRPARPA